MCEVMYHLLLQLGIRAKTLQLDIACWSKWNKCGKIVQCLLLGLQPMEEVDVVGVFCVARKLGQWEVYLECFS